MKSFFSLDLLDAGEGVKTVVYPLQITSSLAKTALAKNDQTFAKSVATIDERTLRFNKYPPKVKHVNHAHLTIGLASLLLRTDKAHKKSGAGASLAKMRSNLSPVCIFYTICYILYLIFILYLIYDSCLVSYIHSIIYRY